jgi:lipid II:glycine glycyltransferase (peptidoglycan interpeptide bridge formation enzyme)
MVQDLKEICDSAEWDRALADFEFVPPGQVAPWSGRRDFRDCEILRFTSAKHGAVAVQGGLKRSLGITRFLVSDGPILGKACDGETLAAFFAALRERLGKGCLLSISSIQPYEPVHEVWLRKAGFQRPWSAILSPLTLYVDCSDWAGLERGFRADWRKCIRKAERSDLAFETVALTDVQAREDLLALHCDTLRDKGVAENIDAPMLEALMPDSRWKVFFASQAGKRLSVRLVFVSGTTAFDFAAGTNAQGRQLSASHFLAASIFKCLGQSGTRWFDFGRIGPGRYDSIDHFKTGSGARPAAYLGEWSLSSRPWLELAVAAAGFFKRGERW